MAVLTDEGQALTIGRVDPDPGPRLPTPRHRPLSHPLPSATTPQGQGRPCLQDCLFPIGRCVLLVFVAEASDENHEAPPQVEVGEEVRPAGDSARRPRLVGHLVSGGSSRREA